jgi:uncharacterized membrane protein
LPHFGIDVSQLFRLPGASSLQNIHPLIVHFPIALLTVALLVYVMSWILRRPDWAWVALWMLALGTAGAAFAVWTGLRAEEGVMIAPSVREHILVHHKHFMITVLVLSVMLTAWALAARPMPSRGRTLFIVMLLALTFCIIRGADYGGWMVFGYNAGGSLPQPIEFSS